MSIVYGDNEGNSVQDQFVQKLTRLLRKHKIPPYQKSLTSQRERFVTSLVGGAPQEPVRSIESVFPPSYYDSPSDEEADYVGHFKSHHKGTVSRKRKAKRPSRVRKRSVAKGKSRKGKSGTAKKKRKGGRRGTVKGRKKQGKRALAKRKSKPRKKRSSTASRKRAKTCPVGGKRKVPSRRELLTKSKTFLVNKLRKLL